MGVAIAINKIGTEDIIIYGNSWDSESYVKTQAKDALLKTVKGSVSLKADSKPVIYSWSFAGAGAGAKGSGGLAGAGAGAGAGAYNELKQTIQVSVSETKINSGTSFVGIPKRSCRITVTPFYLLWRTKTTFPQREIMTNSSITNTLPE